MPRHIPTVEVFRTATTCCSSRPASGYNFYWETIARNSSKRASQTACFNKPDERTEVRDVNLSIGTPDFQPESGDELLPLRRPGYVCYSLNERAARRRNWYSADVTLADDEYGCAVGRALHVATGFIRSRTLDPLPDLLLMRPRNGRPGEKSRRAEKPGRWTLTIPEMAACKGDRCFIRTNRPPPPTVSSHEKRRISCVRRISSSCTTTHIPAELHN